MKAFFLILAAAVSGTGLIAYAEGPYAPQGVSLPVEWVERGFVVAGTLAAALEGARRMAHSAKMEAKAADQRATAIGRKHDELQKDWHDEMTRRSGWEGEIRGSLDAMKDRLRVVGEANHATRSELGGMIIRLEDRLESLQE